MKSFRHRALILSVFLFSVPAFAKAKIDKLTFPFNGHDRVYYSFIPDGDGPMPLVVLLHGSGRDGTEMTTPWKNLAAKEHFILAAPNSFNSALWDSNQDPPEFFHSVVGEVKKIHAVDENRIFLFGHSGGAVYALALTLIDSEYYAATAIHAGALWPNNYGLFPQASRKIPIAIWIGDHDSFFPLDAVQSTKRIFESNGYQVQLSVLPNHSHNYGEVADEVNSKAWKFFKASSTTPAQESDR